jgi:ferredoxin-type protein NapG
MATTLQSVGLTALGGLLWSGYTDEVKASPLVLRPPGAIKEDDFLTACIKCGLCAEACQNRETNLDKETGLPKEGTLKMAKGGDHKLIGTPYFIPTEVPCYMCEDIPCVPVCPSGALDQLSVSNDKGELDINKASMGLAVVHKESCIAYWGIQCDACYRACPILGQAITIEYDQNTRTGKHAFMKPIVHSDACTGCGLCEHACVTEKPAIFVLPREVAMGKAGSHYIKGWDKSDEKRLEGATTTINTTEISKKVASDKLNSDMLEDLY